MNIIDRMKNGFIVIVDCNSNWLEEEHNQLIKLADIGKLALETELCHWGYKYNDGDCNEEKYPCARNELCKMKAEV